jgi:hypothetical protein
MTTAQLHRGVARCLHLTALLAILCLPNAVFADEYFDKYDLAPSKAIVHMGVQPMAYPLAFISSTMQRDRTLRADLKSLGMELRPFAFRKGNDMVKLMGDGKLELSFLGDMPTVNTLVRTPTAIAGLGKRNFSSVVSHNFSQMESLKGKRIAYSAGSSSHLVLLRGLKAARLQESDVTLVLMEPAQMPDALESGAIDAFSAWEPTPSISIARNAKNRAIYRGMSTDWVVLSREFADQQPMAALYLVASYARAINWMRAATVNLEQAGGWVLGDGESFTAQPRSVSLAKAVEIARKDLLEVPGAPATPAKVDGVAPLTREFEFLQQLQRLPPGSGVEQVTQAFAYTGLKQVQADPKKYKLFAFNYDQ